MFHSLNAGANIRMYYYYSNLIYYKFELFL